MGALSRGLMPDVMSGFTIGLLVTVALFGLLQAIATILQLHFASRHLSTSTASVEGGHLYSPSVDVVIPCFNETPELLEQCLASLARQRYSGKLRIWIVDDGSANVEALRPIYTRYGARPGWRVIELPRNRGKRHAQHAAVAVSNGRLIVSVDSDTEVAEDGISKLVAPFRDPTVGLAAGNLRAANRGQTWLTHLVDDRYKILFEQERAAQSYFGSVLCCSGSFAAYRRSALRRVWPKYLDQRFLGVPCTSGEDLHLTTLILAEGYRSLFEAGARAATSVPSTLRDYVRQQLRWNRSFYRELRWITPMLARLPAYLALDVAARFLVPFMLPAGFLLSLLDSVLHQGSTSWGAGILAGMALWYLALGLWQAGSLRFAVLYGLVYVGLLLPIRIWALCSLRHTHWGTRRDRPTTYVDGRDRARNRLLARAAIALGVAAVLVLLVAHPVGTPDQGASVVSPAPRHGPPADFPPARLMRR